MVIDVLVIIFLLFSVFRGYKKGLAKIIVSFIGFIIAVILAFSFNSSLSEYIINNTEIDNSIKKVMAGGVETALNSRNSLPNLPVQQNNFFIDIINNFGVNEGIDTIANNITVSIIKLASFIIIFLITITIFYIVQMMLNVVFDLPILDGINALGGAIAGLIMGVLKMWVILTIISFIIPFVKGISDLINTTVLTKILYDTNILVGLLANSFKF
jgi:uncharacterized membrane protein required for colicin V production